MNLYRISISPLTAFGTPIVGDTLFGQFCWGIVQRYGEAKLAACLEGYTDDNPFLILSDAFMQNYLPLATLPSSYWTAGEETDRKKLKKKKWLPIEALDGDSRLWQSRALTDSEQAEVFGVDELLIERDQTHNSINRLTGTTGQGDSFAPYESPQWWYQSNIRLDIYCLLDEIKLSLDEFTRVLNDIANYGYGRDATIGLGKFACNEILPIETLSASPTANAYFTLSSSCPKAGEFDSSHSYYQMSTKFGRHGGLEVLSGNPFKKPILMIQTGAVLKPKNWHLRQYVGQGLGDVSVSQPEAVHQGYAIVVPFELA